MRLSEMIIREMEGILGDFEDFARTHTAPGASMDVGTLRDHAEEMLRAFARDMESPQSDGEQRLKSLGKAPANGDGNPTAASLHGHDRAGAGFTIGEMFAEYRALRASVLRHWTARMGATTDPFARDMIRFNEAIDQAIAESLGRYTATVDEHREMFLAVLGHDLRTPLSAILAAAGYLSDGARLDDRSREVATAISRSGMRMNELVNDLLDFTQSRLGGGIPVDRRRADLGAIVRETVDEVRMLNPDREFRFETAGDLTGEWDGPRVAQAVSNLVANAVQHGNEQRPVTIIVRGEDGHVIVAVRNRGSVIPDSELDGIFEPFRRRTPLTEDDRQKRSMGLGLHIAREIARAHGGAIEVDSTTERGTTFTLRLPRTAAAG